MDTNGWRPTPLAGEPSMEAADWRTQLQPDSRQRIVNKIMDTLKRHLPFSGEDGLNEIKKIAGRFEEKIYTAATSQSDYLRRISLKMLSMESNSQNAPNSGGTSTMPPDPDMDKQQNQQSSVQQSTQPMIHPAAFTISPLRPQQQQQSVGVHQHQTPFTQQTMMAPMKQQASIRMLSMESKYQNATNSGGSALVSSLVIQVIIWKSILFSVNNAAAKASLAI